MCVSRRENASDLVQSLWMSRSGMWCTATSCRRSERSLRQCSSKDHSNHLLLSSKCTQMSPETPCDINSPKLVLLLVHNFSRPILTLFVLTLIIKHPHIQINQLSYSLSTKHQNKDSLPPGGLQSNKT
ncbi:hypothetical protein IGI04_026364 [Brassica rapa subsp. trilocularis]|uniref:Uncharacterized protein n=1 Tax=Brassica rapa subsp. trilocularis TaxID=1813537 RepID=A0ABQ7KX30_BRACM|nr:hypothetical protein IGI04_026364 [Brassica rapa subsp. trilocularis]